MAGKNIRAKTQGITAAYTKPYFAPRYGLVWSPSGRVGQTMPRWVLVFAILSLDARPIL